MAQCNYLCAAPSAPRQHTAHISVTRRGPLCLRMYRHPTSLPSSIQRRVRRYHPGFCHYFSPDPPRIVHPHCHRRAPPILLAALTLPALLDLYLVVSIEQETVLPTFLARSKPTLRRLSLTMPHAHEPTLLRILALAPHLDDLTLSSLTPLFTAVISTHCAHRQRLNLPVSTPPESEPLFGFRLP
ncbi:hypothetical protein BD779DRAFT_781861 [Infundibulicybe gibba]|nr:hypothetical protein BD779DRAFT_781861 [Infundibulicybe gibba]